MLEVASDASISVRITLNGVAREGLAAPRMQLADFLRHVPMPTAPGCEHGIAGVHCAYRRARGPRLHDPCAGRRLIFDRLSCCIAGRIECAASGLQKASRSPVRLLHTRHPDVLHAVSGRASEADRSGNPRNAHRPSVSLHRLQGHRRGDQGRGRDDAWPLKYTVWCSWRGKIALFDRCWPKFVYILQGPGYAPGRSWEAKNIRGGIR